MSSSFLPFFGQAASRLPVDETLGDTFPNGIPVSAPTQAAATSEAPLNVEAPAVNMADLLPKNASAEDLQRAMALGNAPAHKGMFGIKGTLRDVLGLVGDAFLVQSGNNPVYRPTRQRERISDALIGMGPGQERDAIARAMAVDPEVGMPLFKDWQSRMSDEAKTESITKSRQATNQIQKIKLAQQWAANTQDPIVLSAIKGWIQDPNATLDDIPDELLGKAAIPAAKQQDIGIARDRLKQQKELELIKEKGRNARDNPPPPPRRQRAQTPLEYYQELKKIPPEQRSEDDRKWIKKYTEGTGRGRGSGRQGGAPSSSPSGSSGKYRDGQILYRGGQPYVVKGGKAYPVKQ